MSREQEALQGLFEGLNAQIEPAMREGMPVENVITLLGQIQIALTVRLARQAVMQELEIGDE